MSLLTRARAIQSKYPTNVGLIRSEEDIVRGILKTQGESMKAFRSQEETYQTNVSNFQTSIKNFKTTYGTGESDDRDTADIYETYKSRKIEEFNKQDFAPAFASVKRMIDAGKSEEDVKDITVYGGHAQTFYDYQRGKVAFAAMEADLKKAFDTQSSFAGTQEGLMGERAKLEEAYAETKSYQEQIDASVRKLRSYGSTDRDISMLLGQPGSMKRGTRQSAQRRTMLTSRSTFA